MAACAWCGHDMSLGASCTLEMYDDMGDQQYTRIRYGDDREGWKKYGNTPPPNCHDCEAALGGLHHPGCDVESCPKCGGQALSCGCSDENG